jgi:hypothetical protein
MFSKFITAVVIGFLTVPTALAQAPSEGTRVRVAGTVDKLDGSKLTVDTKGGQPVTVVLADNAAVFGVEKRSIATSSPATFLPRAASRALTARSMRSRCAFFPKHCAAPEKASAHGTSSRTG